MQFTDITPGVYTWTIYGPVAPVTLGTCVGVDFSGAPVLESGSFAVAGSSTQNTPPVQLDGGVGCYTYAGDFVPTDIPATTITHPRGLAAETVLVSAAVPSVSTTVQTNNNRPGATVSDNVQITGLTENSTYVWALYGPLAPVGGLCSAVDWSGVLPTPITGTVNVTPGTTSYNTGNLTVSDVGCYTYAGVLNATGSTVEVTLDPGDPLESFEIGANSPTIETTASVLTAGPTDIVFDNFTVSNLAQQSATYSWTLVGPVPAIGGSCLTVNWAGAPVHDFGNQIIPGDGDYQTASSVLGNAGCYSYTGSLAATATSGPANQPAGHVDETILVTAVTPTVTTEISSRTAAAGASVTDMIRVDGLLDPTTYDWTLLGPISPVGGVCPTDPAAWSTALTVDFGTIAIPADGDFPTPPVALPSAGCFTYIGTLAANDKSNSVVLPAGVPEETVLASTTTPSIITTASTNLSSPGASVTDSVEITGLGTQDVTYSWTLYGPMTPVTPGTCAGIDWSTAVPFDAGTENITGDGAFTTEASILGNAGCYTYTGSLPATATTDAFTTLRGITEETVLVAANSPTIATVASTNNALPGATVSDAVTITGLGAQASTYTWSLLGPLPEVAGACTAVNWTPALASPFDTGTFPVNGDNTYTTPTTVLGGIGCYTYVGTLAATGTTNSITQLPGEVLETVRVTPRNPIVTTQASNNTASPGVSLSDSVIVSGLNGESTTYSWTLVGPIAPVTPGTCAGIVWPAIPIVDSGSFPVNGNGTYPTASTTLNAAGCYSYTGVLAATTTSTAVTLLAGVPAETVIVAANTPTVTTQASQNTGTPGAVVTDRVNVTNLGAQATTYAWTLLGPATPVTPGTCAGIDWSTQLVFTSGSLPVNGDGPYDTAPSTLTLPGCYSYTGDLAATAGSARAILAAGVPAETVRVDANPATVVTAISDQTTTSGDSVTDLVTIGGLNGETTTYHWALLGPIAPVGNACPTDPAAWVGATTVQTGDLAVVGNGTQSTPSVTVLAAGCYTYTGVLDPTNTSAGVTLQPGDPLETTLTVAAEATILTTVSAFSGQVGMTVNDQIVLSGPIALGTVYTWTLYGPVAPVAGVCSTVTWAGAATFATGTIATTASTTYTTPNTTLTAVGCYSYGAALAASVSSTAATQDPGVASETVQVGANLPGVDTVADDGTALPGTTVNDTVTITGMNGATADYTWNLLGPVAAVGGSCDTVTWAGAPTLFTGTLPAIGDGTHTTPDRTIADVGCYSYTGTLAPSATTDPVTLPAGDIDETFQVRAFDPEVATVATAAPQPGGTTTDSVTVTGSGGASALYSWTLVFAAPDGAGTCAAVDWTADGTVVASDSYTITGDGTTTTPPVAADAAGCYSYTGSLAATATSDAVTLPAGDPDETFLLAPFVPTIETTATINDGLPGDLIADGVEVTNFGIDPAQYTWTLLGPIAPTAGLCSTNPADWATAAVHDTGTFTVNPGTASYQTSDSTLALPGCYSYTGALAGTASSEAVTLQAGVPAETALVQALVPTATTLISSKQVYVNDQVRDQIFLGNTRGATPVITWELVGPVAPIADSCDTVDWTGAVIAFDGVLTTLGDGTYETPLVSPSSPGCYSYVTRIAATATTDAVVLAAGDPDETVKVVIRPAGLASTGSEVQAGVLMGAIVALGLGLVVVAFGRRRRNSSKHSATS